MSGGRLVFLTGATGFIGGRLAAALAERGHRLRCLVRHPARAGALRALGAELVEGDVCDEAALGRGLAGADLAYHLAAIYDLGLVDEAALERTNVGGTRAFLAALRASSCPRAVHVSTTAALGPVDRGEGDEQTRYHGPFPSVYHRTKTRAHELALQAQADGAPLIIACPSFVYGPGDEGFAGRLLADTLRGRMPGLPSRPAWYSFVHVEDVVDGLVAAGERGRTGESYVLSGEAADLNDFLARAAALAGRRLPRLRIPGAVALATGSVFDALGRALGRRFPLSREAAAAGIGGRWLHGHAKAARELGYHPRRVAEGLPETVRWLQSRIEAEP